MTFQPRTDTYLDDFYIRSTVFFLLLLCNFLWWFEPMPYSSGHTKLCHCRRCHFIEVWNKIQVRFCTVKNKGSFHLHNAFPWPGAGGVVCLPLILTSLLMCHHIYLLPIKAICTNRQYSCETLLAQVYYCGLSKLLLENPRLYLVMYLDQYWPAHLWLRTLQYFLDWSGVGWCIPLLHCLVVLLYAVIF